MKTIYNILILALVVSIMGAGTLDIGSASALTGCYRPTGWYASEFILNKPSLKFNLDPIGESENVTVIRESVIYRSHYNESLAVILTPFDLFEEKGLDIRLQMPTRNITTGTQFIVLETDDMETRLLDLNMMGGRGKGWVLDISYMQLLPEQPPTQISNLTKGNLKVTLVPHINETLPGIYIAISAENATGLSNENMTELSNIFDGIGYPISFNMLTREFESKITIEEEHDLESTLGISPDDFDWFEAMKIELEWLRDNRVVTGLADEDIEDIATIAKDTVGEHNLRGRYYNDNWIQGITEEMLENEVTKLYTGEPTCDGFSEEILPSFNLQDLLLDKGYELPVYGADGDFGSEADSAVKQYQEKNKMSADGVVGPNTWLSIRSSRAAPNVPDTIQHGDSGEAVTEMQTLLVESFYFELPEHGIDGEFDDETKGVVEGFQQINDLTVDGICGPETWTALYDPTSNDNITGDLLDQLEAEFTATIQTGDTLAETAEHICWAIDAMDSFKMTSLLDDDSGRMVNPIETADADIGGLMVEHNEIGEIEVTVTDDSGAFSNIEITMGEAGWENLDLPDPWGAGVEFNGEAALDVILDYIKEAILEYYEDAMEDLMEFVEQLPGFALVAKIMAIIDCPRPPLFSPPLDNWIQDIDLNFCRGIDAIALPQALFPKFYTPNLLAIIVEIAKQKLKELILKLTIKITINILIQLQSTMCQMLEDLGQMAAGTYENPATGVDIMDLLRQLAGCEDEEGTDEEGVAAAADALAAVGAEGTEESAEQLMLSLASVITYQEYMDVINCEASEATYQMMANLVASIADLAETYPGLTTVAGIKALFCEIGAQLNLEEFNDQMEEHARSTNMLPVAPTFCDVDGIELFKRLRGDLLAEKDPDMTDEQVADQVQAAVDSLEDQFDLLSDLQQGGLEAYIQGQLPPLFPTDGCEENALLPAIPPAMALAASAATKGALASVQDQYFRDIGYSRGGFFDYMLCDKKGTTFSTHNWVYELFYSFRWFERPVAVYPNTIAQYMRDQMRQNGGAFTDLCGGQSGSVDSKDNFTFDSPSYINNGGTGTSYNNNTRDPDAILTFNDSEGTWASDFYVEVQYWNFLTSDEGSTASTDNTFRLKVVENWSEEETMVDITGQSEMSDEVEEFLTDLTEGALDLSAGHSRQAEAFAQMIKKQLSEALGVADDNEALGQLTDLFRTRVFNNISEKMIKGLLLETCSPFEWNSTESPSWFWGKKFGEEPVPDPMNPEENLEIEPDYKYPYAPLSQNNGMVGVASVFVPPWDACNPPGPDVMQWDEMCDIIDELQKTLPEDERLGYLPDCRQDPPFDRIQGKFCRGGTEGMIKVIMRIHIVEIMIKSLHTFLRFQSSYSGTHDDLFLSYLVSRTSYNLKEDGKGFWGQENWSYYYEFIEQCARICRRKVEAGEIENPSEELEQALSTIADEVEKWKTDRVQLEIPPKILDRFMGVYREKWEEVISRAEPAALVCVKELYKLELGPMMDNLHSAVQGYPIINASEDFGTLHKLLLGLTNDNWVPTFDAPSHLALKDEEGELSITEADDRFGTFLTEDNAFNAIQTDLEADEEEGRAAVNGHEATVDRFADGWFFLERYIRVDEKWTTATEYSDGWIASGEKSVFDFSLSEAISFGIDETTGESSVVDEETFAVAAAEFYDATGHTVTADWSDEGEMTAIYVDGVLIESASTISDLIVYEPNSRDPRLYGIMNIEAWKDFIQASGLEGTIADYFENWYFGLRLCYVPSLAERTDWGDDSVSIPSLIKTLVDDESNADYAYNAITKMKSIAIPDAGRSHETTSTSTSSTSDTVARESPYIGSPPDSSADSSKRLYAIPLVSVEVAIEEQYVQNYAGMDDYDEECMLRLLRATPAYKTLFEYCFPMDRFLSLTTIYNAHSTIPSIGQHGEGADASSGFDTRTDGEADAETDENWAGIDFPLNAIFGDVGPGGIFGFRGWDQDVMDETRRRCKRIFRSYYNNDDEGYEDEDDADEGGPMGRLRDRMQPANLSRKGLRWWQKRWFKKQHGRGWEYKPDALLIGTDTCPEEEEEDL